MLQSLTDTLSHLITNLYVSTGLLGIVFAMALESCLIPLPSEIVMPIAGVLIATKQLLSGTSPLVALLLVALAGAVGCLIGSIAAYGIGYSGGRPLILKYGRYVLISQHDADKADAFFHRWGSATAFFSRLLPVIRTYISLPAGISKMPFVKFCIYSFLGSYPWCLLLAYLGLQLGNNLTALSPIFKSLDVVIVLVIVVLVGLYIWRHLRNDKKARAEAALAQNQHAVMSQAWNQQPSPSSSQQMWNQNSQPMQQWGQPQQQGWNAPQSAQPQQGWNMPQPAQPPQPQQQWGQGQGVQPQQQGWNQPAQPQQWGQQGQQPQQSPQQFPQYPQQSGGQPPSQFQQNPAQRWPQQP